ncbi:helix-turn-helix domain-containing protein [Pseudonocardia sp. NPDC049154]|uniref:TetR/AcrR family transcriptional regulator n=1 Tax=Pseudonocardia sp. NPDC049154 TaxID=3155501 RepID=UPI0033D7EF20
MTPTSDVDRAAPSPPAVDSRTRILDAAVACLVEEGFSAATTLRIQARAGISRGRLLHWFPSREALLLAAAEYLADERIRETVERIDTHLTADVPGSVRVAQVVEFMWLTFHEPHFWAAMEIWTAARTNDRIAAALLPAERRLGGVIRAGVDRMWGPELAGHPRYPQLREMLVTSMRGAALTYSFDHRDPRRDPHLAHWTDVARVLLEI